MSDSETPWWQRPEPEAPPTAGPPAAGPDDVPAGDRVPDPPPVRRAAPAGHEPTTTAWPPPAAPAGGAAPTTGAPAPTPWPYAPGGTGVPPYGGGTTPPWPPTAPPTGAGDPWGRPAPYTSPWAAPGTDPFAPGPTAPRSSRARRSPARRALAAVAVFALVLASAGIGAWVARAVDTSGTREAYVLPRTPLAPNGGSGPAAGAFDPDAIAQQVIPGIVNIDSTTGQGRGAGTGIIISSSGLVLTNNHVIADSETLSVDIGGTGDVREANVIGYHVADDVALVQIKGASDLEPVRIGDPSKVRVGDPIITVGNAGGRGGTPKVAEGKVTALDQQVTAGDANGGFVETLTGMIQIDAPIQPGDSGGALVNANGEVIGINTAAAVGQFSQADSVGFSIPISHALDIVEQIKKGDESKGAHIGPRGLLGVQVRDANRIGSSPADSGAYVDGVQSGSGAADAGIREGDVIVSIDGKPIADPNILNLVMTKYHPDDKVEVGIVTSSGRERTVTVTLGEGPPA